MELTLKAKSAVKTTLVFIRTMQAANPTVSANQLQILLQALDTPNISPRELSVQTGLDESTISRCLKQFGEQHSGFFEKVDGFIIPTEKIIRLINTIHG